MSFFCYIALGDTNDIESVLVQEMAWCRQSTSRNVNRNWGTIRYIDHYLNTVKPVCNDHLYNKIYYLWFIQ